MPLVTICKRPGRGTSAAALAGLMSPWQERGRTALPRHGCGRARQLAPMCSMTSRGRSSGGQAPTTLLQALSLLTSQEMMEVALLIPKELMSLYPAAKSNFKVSGQHPAWQPRAGREGKSW